MGRIDVDPNLPPVTIPARLLGELYEHARDEEPFECCGLVTSRGGERFGQVIRCQNIMNQKHASDPQAYPFDAHAGYYIREKDVLAVQQEAERTGAAVTAVYHSHVGTGAYLSETDLAYAANAWFPFPEADQIVLSVFEGQVRARGIFRPGGGGFSGHRLVAEAS